MMKIMIRNLLIVTFLSFGSIETSASYHSASMYEGQSFSHIPYDDLEKIKEAINSAIEAQKDDDDEGRFEAYKKAAKLGHPKSIYLVALYYFQGKITDLDYEQSYIWAKVAWEKGESFSDFRFTVQGLIEALLNKLTAEQQDQADLLLSKCRGERYKLCLSD